MEEKIIILDFLLFGPFWLPFAFHLKASYNFNYLKEINPNVFPGYSSYSDALSGRKWSSEIIMLGMPYFSRDKSLENKKALSLVKKIYYVLGYVYFVILNTIFLLIFLQL